MCRTQQPRICPHPLDRKLTGGRFERSLHIDSFGEACFSTTPLATATTESAAPDTGLSPPAPEGTGYTRSSPASAVIYSLSWM